MPRDSSPRATEAPRRLRAPSPRRLTPRTAYARGRAFELRVRKHLEALGWLVVRTPLSRGPFDLIAVNRGEVLLIQCKGGGGNIPPHDWNRLVDVGERAGAVCLLATRRKRRLAFFRLVDWKISLGRQPMIPVIIGEPGRGESLKASGLDGR